MPGIAATSVPSANDQIALGCRASRVHIHLLRWKSPLPDQSGLVAWQPSSAPLPSPPCGAPWWGRSGWQTSPERPVEYSSCVAAAISLLAAQKEFRDGEKPPVTWRAQRPANQQNYFPALSAYA